MVYIFNSRRMKKQNLLLTLLLLPGLFLRSQFTIQPLPGYSDQIGVTVGMLEDLKGRVTNSAKDLTMEELDFLPGEDANRIGALIMHLAATERYYQVYTFENRQFNEEEASIWDVSLKLGENARAEIKENNISYYLHHWDQVRRKTLELLKTKDDTWFNATVAGTTMNNHWSWYHVMEHQANHMGQIRLIMSRIPK